jgi:hypothetical protein
MAPQSNWSKLKTLLSEMKKTWRETGVKGLYKKYGFKLFLAFFCYYLVRDVTIYILIPWWIAKKTLIEN